MSTVKSITNAFFGEGAPLAAQLIALVEQRSDAGYGGFVDLNNDLGLMVEELADPEPTILMPYFYARRIAAAGMFHQGAIGDQEQKGIEDLFLNYMVQVGSELTQAEQVLFQESSLDSALKLCASYLSGITKKSTQSMLGAAQEGVSVRDCLVNVLEKHYDGIESLVEPVMYRDWIMKPAYCAGYFSAGWWKAGHDFETASEKVLKYFDSIGVSFSEKDVSKESTSPVTDTVSYKNRNYTLISQSDGLFLYEEATQAKWRKYLVHVTDRDGSPYLPAWNGQRFSECSEQKRFRRQARHAEQWALGILREHSSTNSTNLGAESVSSGVGGQIPSPRSAAFDLLLFDLDNTLVKSNDLHAFRGSEYCGTVSAGYIEGLKRAVASNPARRIYSEDCLHELLSSFPGLRLGVVTQAPRAYAETVLLSLYPDIPWRTLVSFDDVTMGKPNPEGIFKAMAATNVDDIRKVALVGDSVNDIKAAYFGGCWSILDKSGWESYDRSAIEKIPDVVIRSPQDLVDAVSSPCQYLPALERAIALPGADYDTHVMRVDKVKHQSPVAGSSGASIHVLGRSFSQYQSLNARRNWHPLTADILGLKDAEIFPKSWISTLCFYLRKEVLLKNGLPIIVTAIPAKPGRAPRLQHLLKQLESAYSATHPEDLNRLVFTAELLGYKQGVRSHHGEHLSRAERFANVQEHILVSQSVGLEGHTVVIIDDVVTTGATLLVAKQALTESGAKRVRCVALAKAVGER